MDAVQAIVAVHDMERIVFRRIIDMGTDVQLSKRILSFWLWLEAEGYNDIVKQLCCHDDELLAPACAEAEVALASLNSDLIQSNSPDIIPITARLSGCHSSLHEIFKNKDSVSKYISGLFDGVCCVIFKDILEERGLKADNNTYDEAHDIETAAKVVRKWVRPLRVGKNQQGGAADPLGLSPVSGTPDVAAIRAGFKLNPFAKEWHPWQERLNPFAKEWHPRQGRLNPFAKEWHPRQGRLNPFAKEWHPRQGRLNPFAKEWHPWQGRLNPFAKEWHPRQGRLNPFAKEWHPRQERLNPLAKEWHPRQGRLNPFAKEWHPGRERLNPLAKEWHPRQGRLNPFAKEWHQGRAPEEDRSLFITFSNGNPLSNFQIWNFFTSNYGECVERVDVNRREMANGRPLFGKVVFNTSTMPALILNRKDRAKFSVHGRPLWCKKNQPKKDESTSHSEQN